MTSPAEEEKENLKKAITLSLNKISIRPRTEKEINDFLTKYSFDRLIVENTISFLKSKKYIDDEDFTNWWIEQRQTFRPKSIPILKNELREKGIDKEVIEKVLSQNPEAELESAKKLLEKNIRKFGDLKNRNNYQKAAQFFQRKGFKWEIIKKILKNVYEED